MASPHPLETLLQNQLATDSSAVLHLPTTILYLAAAQLLPSPHLQKWIARVNSLIYSKDSAARWAGLCIAMRTSLLNQNIMLESAQSWIGVALPCLSRVEPLPVYYACVRLLAHIFSSATNMPEFQRQVVIPNVPKFSLALITLAEKEEDYPLQLLAFSVLRQLITLYPTLHRALHSPILALTLRPLSGDFPYRPRSELTERASQLHACLNATGGKVGAATAWRKSMECAIGSTWACIDQLLSTFFSDSPAPPVTSSFDLPLFPENPLLAIPLAADRLRSMITLLCCLLKSNTPRPVAVPMGALVQLVLRLLRVTVDSTRGSHFDSARRAMELAAIPEMWMLACELIVHLTSCVNNHLTPHVSQLVACIAYHLEQPLTQVQRIQFLQLLHPLLTQAHPLHNTLLLSRLTKNIIPSLSCLLESRPLDTVKNDSSKGKKKGKKAARGYEGDEVFRVGKDIICTSIEEGELALAGISALSPLLRNPLLPPSVRSLTSRILMGILLTLPQYSPSIFSFDPSLHARIYSTTLVICEEAVRGSDGWAGRMLPLLVGAFHNGELSGQSFKTTTAVWRNVELLLHPRLPPLLRMLPPLEELFLSPEEKIMQEQGEMAVNGDEPPQFPAISKHASSREEPITRTILSTTPAAAIFPSLSNPIVDPPMTFRTSQSDSEQPLHSPSTNILGPEPRTTATVNLALSFNLPPTGSLPTTGARSDDDDEEMPAIDMSSDSE